MEIPSRLSSCVSGKDCKDFVLGGMDCSAVCASSFVKISTCKAEVYDVRCCQVTVSAVTGISEPSCCLMWHLGAALDSVLHWDTSTGYRSKWRELHHPILGKCKWVCLRPDLLEHPWRPVRGCCAVCWAPSPQRQLLEGRHFTCCISLLSLLITLLWPV